MAESPEFDRADIRQRLEKVAELNKRLVVLFVVRYARSQGLRRMAILPKC